jgi:hypothetical protein
MEKNNTNIENEYLKMWIEDNILFGVYKLNTNIDLAAAQKCVSDRISISHGKNYPVLVDIRNIKSINKAARDYFASKEGLQYIEASAILVDSYLSKLLSHIFLTFSTPPIPTKMFTGKEQALVWLKKNSERV